MVKLIGPNSIGEQYYKFYHNDKEYGSFRIINRCGHKEIWAFGIYNEKDRGKGLGQKMLKECLNLLSGHIVELGCLKNNDRALHIYKKFGFTIIKDCGSYYWMRREVE